MRKTRVLLLLFILFGGGLFAQSENKALAGNEPLLNTITQLKEQANNVNTAFAQLQAATTGTRSMHTVAAAALNDACNTYLAELTKQHALNAAGSAISTAIDREIAAVKKIQADYCQPGK